LLTQPPARKVRTMSLAHDLQYASELARGAGKIILEKYGKVERLTKTHVAASQEAVTEADRASQRYIVAGLRTRFPQDGIVGEESETGESITFDSTDPAGRNWVIDPIDGTNNFVAGLGNFAVCIGLIDKGWPVLGVVYDVTRDLMYTAARGEGAWLGMKRLEALTTPLSASSIIMFTSNARTQGRYPVWGTKCLTDGLWNMRLLGSAALEAVYVAAGVAHASVTVNGKLWDVAAAAALVLESGAKLTDLGGKPVFPFDLAHYQGAKVPFLAAGPAAHAELLRIILDHP
jgi:myo-inositol-1(or 4)-monophosphatase